MLKDAVFGQYYPVKSPVHRMDSFTKIVLLIIYIVMVFVAKNFWGFLVVGVFLLVTILASKVPFKSVARSIKAVYFIIAFTFIINIFFHKEEGAKVLWDVWLLRNITDKSLIYAVFMALRFTLLMFGSSLLTLTSSPVELTNGIEVLLKPLTIFKIPVHILALMMSIALRFIATLMEETERIINAQKARGADFESGNIFKRAKALLPVLIPLLTSALRRAEELGDAMDARCFSSTTKRTKFKKLTFSWRDLIGLLFTLATLSAVILCNNFLVAII